MAPDIDSAAASSADKEVEVRDGVNDVEVRDASNAGKVAVGVGIIGAAVNLPQRLGSHVLTPAAVARSGKTSRFRGEMGAKARLY